LTFTLEQLTRAAWLSGSLDYKIAGEWEYQLPAWNAIKAFVGLTKEDVTSIKGLVSAVKAITVARQKARLVLNITRRYGKTSLCFLALICLSIRNPEHTYLYVAPTEKDAKDIIGDIAPILLADCPSDLKPKFKGHILYFNNGSRIKIGGTWNGAEGLRGRSAHGILVDEAAFVPQHSSTSCLSYVLGSVLTPQLQTTKGFLLIASTPPRSLQHDYVRIFRAAELDGSLLNFDIYQVGRLTPDEIEQIKQESYVLDPTGSAWKREYLVMLVPDANDLIVPEAAFLKIKTAAIKTEEHEHFHFLHRYVSFDHGTTDLNAVLFGFYDFRNAKKVIQRELIMDDRPTTQTIAKRIAEVKYELWGELPVYRSICDSISKQLILDLNQDKKIKQSGIVFVNPSKTDLEAMVNQLIISLDQEQWIIDPSCKMTLETLRTGTWKTSATTGKREFARLGEIGHCDALASLVYFNRALNTRANPFTGKNLIGDMSNKFISPTRTAEASDQPFRDSFARAHRSKINRR